MLIGPRMLWGKASSALNCLNLKAWGGRKWVRVGKTLRKTCNSQSREPRFRFSVHPLAFLQAPTLLKKLLGAAGACEGYKAIRLFVSVPKDGSRKPALGIQPLNTDPDFNSCVCASFPGAGTKVLTWEEGEARTVSKARCLPSHEDGERSFIMWDGTEAMWAASRWEGWCWCGVMEILGRGEARLTPWHGAESVGWHEQGARAGVLQPPALQGAPAGVSGGAPGLGAWSRSILWAWKGATGAQSSNPSFLHFIIAVWPWAFELGSFKPFLAAWLRRGREGERNTTRLVLHPRHNRNFY